MITSNPLMNELKRMVSELNRVGVYPKELIITSKDKEVDEIVKLQYTLFYHKAIYQEVVLLWSELCKSKFNSPSNKDIKRFKNRFKDFGTKEPNEYLNKYLSEHALSEIMSTFVN